MQNGINYAYVHVRKTTQKCQYNWQFLPTQLLSYKTINNAYCHYHFWCYCFCNAEKYSCWSVLLLHCQFMKHRTTYSIKNEEMPRLWRGEASLYSYSIRMNAVALLYVSMVDPFMHSVSYDRVIWLLQNITSFRLWAIMSLSAVGLMLLVSWCNL